MKNIAKIFAIILAIVLLISMISVPLTQCNKKTPYAQSLAENSSDPWMGILLITLGLFITAGAFIYMYRTMKKNRQNKGQKPNNKYYRHHNPKESDKQ